MSSDKENVHSEGYILTHQFATKNRNGQKINVYKVSLDLTLRLFPINHILLINIRTAWFFFSLALCRSWLFLDKTQQLYFFTRNNIHDFDINNTIRFLSPVRNCITWILALKCLVITVTEITLLHGIVRLRSVW